jgi:mycofactocin system glycosyltransferase
MPAATTRFRLDDSVQRHGNVLIGGSPLKLFRLTDAGARVVGHIASGEPVDSERPSKLLTSLLDAGVLHPIPEGSAFTAADVTVVTPTLGEPAYVAPQAIVVDDGSPHPVAAATIRLAHNQGPAAARNAGLGGVTTRLVAFVDADVELPDGWLEPLIAHFDDPLVAAVAPRVRTGDDGSPLARYEHRRSPLDLGPQPARVRAGTRVSYVPAAVLLCRVGALEAVGGFDTSLRFGEDVDLVWRLDDAGWRCRYEPSVEVFHDPRPSWSGWFRQRVGYGSSAAPLARRHPGALAPIRMSGWSVAAWALAALGRPVLGAAVGAGSAAALVAKLPDVPPRQAFRLAGLGNLHAGDQISNAIRRVWWPLLAIAAWRCKPARRTLVAAALAARSPIRIADDLAYSIGVWKGILAERTPAPLVPEITAWPGRQPGTP